MMDILHYFNLFQQGISLQDCPRLNDNSLVIHGYQLLVPCRYREISDSSGETTQVPRGNPSQRRGPARAGWMAGPCSETVSVVDAQRAYKEARSPESR